MSRILALLLLIFPTFAALAQEAQHAKPWERLDGCRFVENRWNDGDSFHVEWRGKEFIFRLYFVDTPETDSAFPDRVAEQGAYFGKSVEDALLIGKQARSEVSALLGEAPFTVWTRWRDARGRSNLERFNAIVIVGGRDLNEVLVERGFARIFGTRVSLPDGRLSRDYIVQLKALEADARKARRGGWK